MKRKSFEKLLDECFGVSDKLLINKDNAQKIINKFLIHFYSEDTKYIQHLEAKLEQFGKSTSDLKTEFMGQYSEEIEDYDPETDEEIYRRVPVSWTLTKQIFKEMCDYIKNRDDKDIRP